MIKDRAKTALNLKQYSEVNYPEKLEKIELDQPDSECYVLRMLVQDLFGPLKLPKHLEWTRPLIIASKARQEEMSIAQPFIYLTVRKGHVKSVTDDEWHVDGFSMSYTHLPEQNYIWADRKPTEYVEKGFNFPSDFDPLRHNIHSFFQNRVNSSEIKQIEPKTLYCMDPYVLHRRPKLDRSIERCFIRVSFTPIEIRDVNNTENPLIETNYTRDGVKAMRDQLTDYDKYEQ